MKFESIKVWQELKNKEFQKETDCRSLNSRSLPSNNILFNYSAHSAQKLMPRMCLDRMVDKILHRTINTAYLQHFIVGDSKPVPMLN